MCMLRERCIVVYVERCIDVYVEREMYGCACGERRIAMYVEKKEGNVLFNDALNIFYLRLYRVTHMDHSDSEREEIRCRHMCYSSD